MFVKLFTDKKILRTIIFYYCIGIFLIILGVFLIPKEFTSKSIFGIDTMNGGGLASLMSDLGGLSSISGIAGLGEKSGYGKVEAIFESEELRRNIIDKFDLKRHYGNTNDTIYYNTLIDLNSNIELTVEKGGTLLLEVTDKNPKIALLINEFVLKSLDSLLIQYEIKKTGYLRESLRRKYFEIMTNVFQVDSTLENFQYSEKLIDPILQYKGYFENLTKLKEKIQFLQVEADFFKKTKGFDSPEYINTTNQLNSVQDKYNEMVFTTENTWGSEPDLIKSPTILKKYTAIKRNQAMNSKLIEVVLPIYEKVKLDEDSKVRSITIYSRPLLPEYKSKPKRIFLILGFSIAFSIIYFTIIMVFKNKSNITRQNSSKVV